MSRNMEGHPSSCTKKVQTPFFPHFPCLGHTLSHVTSSFLERVSEYQRFSPKSARRLPDSAWSLQLELLIFVGEMKAKPWRNSVDSC